MPPIFHRWRDFAGGGFEAADEAGSPLALDKGKFT